MELIDFYGNFHDFLLANEKAVFRLWVYRRESTPIETQNAFMDDSMYEANEATVGMIRQCTSLGNGDFLIGFQEIEDTDGLDPESCYDWITYYKLSEIRLELAKTQ